MNFTLRFPSYFDITHPQCDEIGRLLDLGQLFKVFGNSWFAQTFLGNFCKGDKIFNFSSEIIFGELWKTFGDFLLVTLQSAYLLCFYFNLPTISLSLSICLPMPLLWHVAKCFNAYSGVRMYEARGDAGIRQFSSVRRFVSNTLTDNDNDKDEKIRQFICEIIPAANKQTNEQT